MSDPVPERPKTLPSLDVESSITVAGSDVKKGPAKAPAADLGNCADNFTFRLVRRGNRYYFQDVRLSGALANHEEALVVQRWLEGRALDEINPNELAEAFSGAGRCLDLQGVIQHLKEMLGD